MTCQEARERIALGDENLWLDEAFEAHLSECDECADYYADFCAMEKGLGEWAEQAPPEGLHDKCMKALAAEEAAAKRKRRTSWVRAGSTIAAALVVAFGALWFTSLGGASPDVKTNDMSAQKSALGTENSGMDDYVPEAIMRAPNPMSDTAEPDATGGTAPTDTSEKKLVYNAHLSMQTRDFEADRDAILEQAQQAGGYVDNQSSHVNDAASGGDGLRSAYFQIRIPSDRYDAFLATLEGIGTTVSKSANVVDISENYYDVQARLDSYASQMRKIDELMQKAESLSDVADMQTRIAELQAQIDALTGDLRRMDTQITYSTITIDLNEISQMSVAPMGSQIGNRMGAGFFRTINAMIKGAENALVWLVASLPMLILLAAIAAIAIVIVRRVLRKRRHKELGSNGGDAVLATPRFDDPEQ